LESTAAEGFALDGVFFLGVRSTRIYCRRVASTTSFAAETVEFSERSAKPSSKDFGPAFAVSRMKFRLTTALVSTSGEVARAEQRRVVAAGAVASNWEHRPAGCGGRSVQVTGFRP